ncbi:MAG: ester cyclase [Lewinellaceae bacterium]|nr:ester cyclase [Lewinellaceae bacterium]MCB9355428.1 ester cyclase [Lewinellaceae bacterium]
MKTWNRAALALLFVMVCAPAFAQTAAQNKETALKAIESLNNKDFDGFGSMLADNFTEYAGPEPVEGKAKALEGIKEYFGAFPDMHIEVSKSVSEGKTVMVLSTVTGTWKNDLMGMKATGKSFKIIDVDIIEFNDAGKAVAHWSVQDPMVMMSQISN